MTQKTIIIIAGPNGAGKTTFARQFLPNEAGCPIFVNADLIAAGLSPFSPEHAAIKAGRLMLEELADHAQRGDSFAFETTLSRRAYVRMIRQWRAQGYRVKLIFLALASPEEAIARVVQRVAQAGISCPMSLCYGGLLLGCGISKLFIVRRLTIGSCIIIAVTSGRKSTRVESHECRATPRRIQPRRGSCTFESREAGSGISAPDRDLHRRNARWQVGPRKSATRR